jgi:hypothetical protein
MERFAQVLVGYLWEVVPALAVGFLISGLMYELVPERTVYRHLGHNGVKPVLYATLLGTIMPVCCWGSLPIAVSFREKGAKLGPILAFLVSTPATSVSALAVAYSLLGVRFTLYIYFAVIVMGLAVGIIGNSLASSSPSVTACEPGCEAGSCDEATVFPVRRTLPQRAKSVLRYAFITMPREIGLEIAIGLLLAAAVESVVPVQRLVETYLKGWSGYLFSVIFGILTYLCSTASVPLVDSLIRQGLKAGAGMTLLLIGPVTSYGTMLVLRKEFGVKVLMVYLVFLIVSALLLGLGYQFLS